MTKHRLVFTANRSTPKVLSVGKKYTPKKNYGRVVKTRRATAAEEKIIASGRWLRVDAKGRKPSAKSYKGHTGGLNKVNRRKR